MTAKRSNFDERQAERLVVLPHRRKRADHNENIDECYDFFEDLCTVTELKALSQRIVVAKMLSDKQVYSEIVSKTGASTATISRVNRSLNYGCDGYEKIFERIDAAEAEKKD